MSTLQEMFSTHGLSQAERALRALAADYVGFDERSTAQLLAYLTRLGERIPFYDEQDQIVSDWGHLLKQDVSVLLALMLQTDLKAIQQTAQRRVQVIRQLFLATEETLDESEKYQQLRQYAQAMLELPVRMQAWQQWGRIHLAPPQSVEGQVGALLRQVIERQARPQVQRLRRYDLGAAKDLGQPLDLDFLSLSPLWEVDAVETPEYIFEGSTPDQRLNRGFVRLQLLQREMFDSLVYLIAQARRSFELSLTRKADHAPNLGLLMAFLKLFDHVREDLNGLRHAHLDLYYRRVLGQQEAPAQPDHAYLLLGLSPEQPELLLPAGTRFDGGSDPDGNAVVYESLRSTLLNQASIGSLRTLFIGKNTDDISGQHEIITGIYAAPVANSADGQGKAFEDDQREWPLFGEEQSKRLPAHRTMTRAEVGFALSTPALFLQEGKRQVHIHLQALKSSAETLRQLLLGLASGPGEDSLQSRFYEVFPEGSTHSLEFWLTGAEGWFRVDPFAVQIHAPDWEADATYLDLSFSFELHSGDPAVVAFRGDLHPGLRYATRYPVLRVLLAPLQPFPYSFLANLELTQAQVEVSVEGLRDLRAYNDLGEIDLSQPFQPFGAQPKVGSYLMVGHVELFRKRLSDLTFHLDWMDLPGQGTVEDFKAHYAGFRGMEFDPHQYRVRLSALSEHRFVPEETDQQALPLFTEREVNIPGSISGTMRRIRHSTLDKVNLAVLNLRPIFHLRELPDFSTQAELGYFKLELAAPMHAFGHQRFGDTFTQVAQENAQKMSAGEEDAVAPLPAQPYTPQLRGLAVSYRARGTIRLSSSRQEEGSLFHILPFGTDKISAHRASGQGAGTFPLLPSFGYAAEGERSMSGRPIHPRSLLAQDRDQGYLFIGLRGLRPPQPVSMLFQLSSRYTQSHSDQQTPQPIWAYLSSDHWHTLEPQALLEDGTDLFTRTGIITVQLPADIDDRNNLMPSGYYWLRIAVQGNLAVFCQALEIHTQAVEVRWVDQADSRRLAEPLPAERITAPVSPIPAIRQVLQPYPSFGGKPQEEAQAFYQRVGERLSHKQRAVSALDFERIVLQAFPDIHQVKCLTHQNSPQSIQRRGEVVLVVAPEPNTYDPTVQGLTPKVNYRSLLAIEAYLRAHASPFARIMVRNPSYEYLRVCAKVKFVAGQQNGYSLQRLQDDLVGFICPWYHDASQPFPIGRSLAEEDILNFAKSLDYVQFITSFSIIHIFPEDEARREYKFLETAELPENVVIVPKPWAVLVPDEMHEIELIEEEREEVAQVRGNRPVRFQRRVDLFPSREQERHLSQKESLRDTTRLTTHSGPSERYQLRIDLDAPKR